MASNVVGIGTECYKWQRLFTKGKLPRTLTRPTKTARCQFRCKELANCCYNTTVGRNRTNSFSWPFYILRPCTSIKRLRPNAHINTRWKGHLLGSFRRSHIKGTKDWGSVPLGRLQCQSRCWKPGLVVLSWSPWNRKDENGQKLL